MSQDRTVAPDARRLALAHRVGLRPSGRLLFIGALLGALLFAEPWTPLVTLVSSTPQVFAPTFSIALAPGLLEAAVAHVGRVLVAVVGSTAVVVVGLALASGIVRRSLGVVRGGELHRLRPSAVTGTGSWSIVAAGVFVSVMWLFSGGVAGAARAVDATASSLHAFYLAWWREVAWALVAVGMVGGLIEVWLSGRELRQRLYRSTAEVRDAARG